ncbi:MAG: flagellin, partial [Gammaproteobacteria bacterium]
ATAIATGGALTLNGTDVTLTGAETTVTEIVNAINAVANDSGVTAQKSSSLDVALAFSNANSDTVTVNGVDVSYTAGATIDTLIADINAVSGQTGVTASNVAGEVSLSSDNAADFTLTTTNTALGGGAIAGETYSAGILLSADIGTTTDPDDTILIAGAGDGNYGIDETEVTNARNILNDVSVLTGADATAALLTLDFALNQVSGQRSELGAVQTRFESTIANLSITSENASSARSRILDADFAAETSNLTRASILQQAGTAMLAQANALPQNVLSLLG